MRNLRILFFFGLIYFVLNYFFLVSYIMSDAYVNYFWGMVFKLVYFVLVFIGFRWRFYVGWFLVESCCMIFGLGAYSF